jgi:hypothetical protein
MGWVWGLREFDFGDHDKQPASRLGRSLSVRRGGDLFRQDWIIKLLSGDYPVHQAIAIRGVVAVLILLAYITLDGKIESLRSKRMDC